MKKNIFYISLCCLFLLTACEPKEEDKITLGQAPQPSFTFDFIDPNNIRFTNTTTDEHFITNWDLGEFGTFKEDVVEVNFPTAGEYPAKLTVFGQGGSNTTEQMITITQNDPSACTELYDFITCGGERTWRLNPAQGALWVGPDAGTGTIWWENSATDVTGRDCDWNDEYRFNRDGEYIYDSKGDLWGESYTGFSSDACYSTSELSANLAAWGSGTHAFEVIPGDDNNPAKLRVIGDGAFLGLRKAANGAEVSAPQSEVTYDITDIRSEGNLDIMELLISFGGGYWRFTIASDKP